MSVDADLMKLYSGRILALAADIPCSGRLEAPQGSARRRSPLCGSTVTVDLTLNDGRIAGFAQQVKACALGQASAAVLGAVATGLDRATLQRGQDELRAMLKSGGPAPSAPFEGLEALLPAREFKNRHASIMLAFEAAVDAFDAAASAGQATAQGG